MNHKAYSLSRISTPTYCQNLENKFLLKEFEIQKFSKKYPFKNVSHGKSSRTRDSLVYRPGGFENVQKC